MVAVLSTLAPALAPFLSQPYFVPRDELLAAICDQETTGERRSWAVNRYGSAWGKCQIKYWSAVHFGRFDEQLRLMGISSRSPAELFDDSVNEEVASNILGYCRIRNPGATARRLAYCWLAGPNSKPYKNREGYWFSKRVASAWAAVNFQLQFFSPTIKVLREREDFYADRTRQKNQSDPRDRVDDRRVPGLPLVSITELSLGPAYWAP